MYPKIKHSLMSYAPFLILFAMFFVGADLANASIEDFGAIGIVAGGIKAMAIPVVNISKVDTKFRRGNQTNDRLWILLRENADLDNIPLVDEDNQTIADIPLVSGGYWFYIDVQKASVIPQFNTDGDFALQFIDTVNAVLEGLSTETRAFLQKNAGRDVFIAWETCATGEIYIAGTKCRGLTMQISDGGWLAEMTGATLLFTATCDQIPVKYLGTISTQPAVTVAADATEIAYDNSNSVYQLTDGSVASVNITTLSGLTAADHNKQFKILGSGGTFPSTIDADDDFILKDGTTWTGEAGAQITFTIFKDGASTYKFVEVSRV